MNIFSLGILLLLASSCYNDAQEESSSKAYSVQEEQYFKLKYSDTIIANGLREEALKLPNAFQQDYQLTYSKELKVFSYQDTFIVTTLYPGNYYFIQIDPLGDTLLNIDIFAQPDETTQQVLEVIERKDRNEIMNTKHASMFYTSHFMLNKKLPDFKVSVFDNGVTFEEDFKAILNKDKVSIIYIWEHGCPACKEANIALNDIPKEEANQLFNFYTVFYHDIEVEKGMPKFPNKMSQFTRRGQKERIFYHDFPLKYGHILFNASLLTDVLNFSGYPQAFIIDQDGVVRSVINGFMYNYKDVILDQVHMVNQLINVPYDE